MDEPAYARLEKSAGRRKLLRESGGEAEWSSRSRSGRIESGAQAAAPDGKRKNTGEKPAFQDGERRTFFFKFVSERF